MNIKDIALKVADSLRNKIDGISHMQSNQGLVRFAEALITELAKQNEPVAFTNSAQLGYVTSGQHQDIPLAMWSRNTSYSGADIPLYTFPPTAEQIANETAEACAAYCEAYDLANTTRSGIFCAKSIRSGAWKDFKK